MTTPQYLQAQFERCMPLFIALGDPVRLSNTAGKVPFPLSSTASMSMKSPAAPVSPAPLFPTI